VLVVDALAAASSFSAPCPEGSASARSADRHNGQGCQFMVAHCRYTWWASCPRPGAAMKDAIPHTGV